MSDLELLGSAVDVSFTKLKLKSINCFSGRPGFPYITQNGQYIVCDVNSTSHPELNRTTMTITFTMTNDTSNLNNSRNQPSDNNMLDVSRLDQGQLVSCTGRETNSTLVSARSHWINVTSDDVSKSICS